MQTLAKHAAEGADEDVLEGDQQAVDLAAAAMSQAVAAMAREERQAAEARRASEQRGAEAARRDDREGRGLVEADGGVDTYA